MKKLLFLILLLPLATGLKAQTDSTENYKITIGGAVYDKLRADSKALAEAQHRTVTLQHRFDALHAKYAADSAALAKFKAESDTIHKQLLYDDKVLVSIAANFLYIPYEAYSIDNLALKAYRAVKDENLRTKYATPYQLLQNYYDHVAAFKDFLEQADKELKNPFWNKEEIPKTLHNSDFYKQYQQYSDWQSTYLGKRIRYVESNIQKLEKGKSHPDFFKHLADELNACLKTKESL